MDEKTLLENLVKECNSFTEILRKLGKAVSGASLKLLKQKLEDYDIQYSFLRQNSTKIWTIEEILQKDVVYKSSKLKNLLIKNKLKEDICEVCGQKPFWNGKPLTLQLDHINGDHTDNRLENLRIICPNCHTQTDTFGNKKNKIENYCIDCGKKISNKSIRCLKCAAKYTAELKKQNLNRPTKEKLKELIMTNSFVEIGKMYGVADNAVRKWCKKYNLPYLKADIKKEYFGEEHIPLNVVKCLNCGNEFKQNSNTNKFCCRDCYTQYVKTYKSSTQA